MKMLFLVICFCLTIAISGFSQEVKWKVGLFSFFDNNEFGHSVVQAPQTMSGVLFLPEVGFCWDSVQRVNVGIDLLHEFGSSRAIDYFYPTVYYETVGSKLFEKGKNKFFGFYTDSLQTTNRIKIVFEATKKQ